MASFLVRVRQAMKHHKPATCPAIPDSKTGAHGEKLYVCTIVEERELGEASWQFEAMCSWRKAEHETSGSCPQRAGYLVKLMVVEANRRCIVRKAGD